MTDREHRLRQRIDTLNDRIEDLEAELQRRVRGWTRVDPETVEQELRDLAATLGRAPRSRDDRRLAQRCKYAHGTWNQALQAAGIEPTVRRGVAA